MSDLQPFRITNGSAQALMGKSVALEVSLQRLLALTAAIWHNHHSGQPRPRSLVAYDH